MLVNHNYLIKNPFIHVIADKRKNLLAEKLGECNTFSSDKYDYDLKKKVATLRWRRINRMKKFKAKKRLDSSKPIKAGLILSSLHAKMEKKGGKNGRHFHLRPKSKRKPSSLIMGESQMKIHFQERLAPLFEHMRTLFAPREIRFSANTTRFLPFLRSCYSFDRIRDVTSSLYTHFCKERYKDQITPLALQNQFVQSVAMHAVVLPAFFNRNVILCPPLPKEAKRIMKKLYVDDFAINQREDLIRIIENQGCLTINDQLHRVIVIFDMETNKSCGAIHFKIEQLAKNQFNCVIYSLKISKKYASKGYGRLALLYGIKVAQEGHCESITLKSSQKAIEFYFKFGFRANSNKVESLEDWENLDDQAKDEILQDCDRQMILEFCDSRTEDLLDEQIELA